jgi:hypothetical protein
MRLAGGNLASATDEVAAVFFVFSSNEWRLGRVGWQMPVRVARWQMRESGLTWALAEAPQRSERSAQDGRAYPPSQGAS